VSEQRPPVEAGRRPRRGENAVCSSYPSYEIDREDLAATERLLARNPHAMTYGLRIGYEAAYELGGHLRGNAP
jgi:hypothetical protein